MTRGPAALKAANLPMIEAVGAAAAEPPRLLDLVWGREDAPKVTLVGKGVCFDTGGLDIKPPASMGLMKKDMGGAATAMGLADMVMGLGLDLRLRLLVPAVENAISGAAMRPGDILPSRKGLTVEVNNTDAEGRLVLADALALADEEAPDLVVSLATLTGAARVALGPDVPPFFTDDDALAADLAAAAARVADPLWRLPFWDPYEPLIEPGIADLDNAPSGGMAGAITAALFLRRFVTASPRYLHVDIYGWTPKAAPARAEGRGVPGGARAPRASGGALCRAPSPPASSPRAPISRPSTCAARSPPRASRAGQPMRVTASLLDMWLVPDREGGAHHPAPPRRAVHRLRDAGRRAGLGAGGARRLRRLRGAGRARDRRRAKGCGSPRSGRRSMPSPRSGRGSRPSFPSSPRCRSRAPPAAIARLRGGGHVPRPHLAADPG